MRAAATTPAEPADARVARFPAGGSLPRQKGGSASALLVSGPAQRSLALQPAWSLSRPRRPRYILSDKKVYSPHLDNITIGESRVTWALSNISRAIGGDDEAIGEKAAEVQKPLASPETPEERALRAQKDAQEFSRLQSAAYNATGEARKAAQKAFDDYLEREAHEYETPREERRHAFDTDPAILSGSNDIPEDSQQAQQQSASLQTPEERARQAQEDAREFSRLQSAAYNATGEARKAAQKAFDDYLEREAHKYDTPGEKERQTRTKSRGLRMRL